jgi:hypothetical protein
MGDALIWRAILGGIGLRKASDHRQPLGDSQPAVVPETHISLRF